MENYLRDYNGVSKRPMNLAIFLFAVEHVSRICRVLKQPGGHMLLVGVGGSGRQSLTRLGASVSAMQVFQVLFYAIKHEDLKFLYTFNLQTFRNRKRHQIRVSPLKRCIIQELNINIIRMVVVPNDTCCYCNLSCSILSFISTVLIVM